MRRLEKEDLFKLYSLAIDEEHYFNDVHANTVKFYAGFISALWLATVAGLVNSREWWHFAGIVVGQALIYMVSEIAIRTAEGRHRQYLEAITVRAKLEQLLGLTVPSRCRIDKPRENIYWPGEPIIYERHLEGRMGRRKGQELEEGQSSRAWVESHANKGFQRLIWRFFRFAQGIALLTTFAVIAPTCSRLIPNLAGVIPCIIGSR